ncbi:MAG: hypothetical protein KatS3mg131_2870 [Candidatus Tectimicrobiota bacterium]|nr:MAG: hypothetical protein KatS3mg131_2870 [Candidatus Tectomicrobia bacterium]
MSCGGVLLVDKPRGLTSHGAVAQVRRLFGLQAVGHTGTLDPEGQRRAGALPWPRHQVCPLL